MGDEIPFGPPTVLHVSTPSPAVIRLFRNGVRIAKTKGRKLRYPVKEPGVYRVEAYKYDVRYVKRVLWILSNPIYIRDKSHEGTAR